MCSCPGVRFVASRSVSPAAPTHRDETQPAPLEAETFDLFVGQLSPELSQELELKRIFKEVMGIQIEVTRRGKHCMHVQVKSRDDFEKAMSFHQRLLIDRDIVWWEDTTHATSGRRINAPGPLAEHVDRPCKCAGRAALPVHCVTIQPTAVDQPRRREAQSAPEQRIAPFTFAESALQRRLAHSYSGLSASQLTEAKDPAHPRGRLCALRELNAFFMADVPLSADTQFHHFDASDSSSHMAVSTFKDLVNECSAAILLQNQLDGLETVIMTLQHRLNVMDPVMHLQSQTKAKISDAHDENIILQRRVGLLDGDDDEYLHADGGDANVKAMIALREVNARLLNSNSCINKDLIALQRDAVSEKLSELQRDLQVLQDENAALKLQIERNASADQAPPVPNSQRSLAHLNGCIKQLAYSNQANAELHRLIMSDVV